MPEGSSHTTANGHEIQHPREKLSLAELKGMLVEYGVAGDNPTERLNSLRSISVDNLALLITDMNKRLQGSDDALISDEMVKVKGKDTLDPIDRYNIFTRTVERVKQTSDDINPARVGDILAMTTVLTHPFKDGSGRTARILGFIFRDDFDSDNAEKSFETLAESRDALRTKGFVVSGYVPRSVMMVGDMPLQGPNPDIAGAEDINDFIDELFVSDRLHLYEGPYSQAPLHSAELAGTI